MMRTCPISGNDSTRGMMNSRNFRTIQLLAAGEELVLPESSMAGMHVVAVMAMRALYEMDVCVTRHEDGSHSMKSVPMETAFTPTYWATKENIGAWVEFSMKHCPGALVSEIKRTFGGVRGAFYEDQVEVVSRTGPAHHVWAAPLAVFVTADEIVAVMDVPRPPIFKGSAEGNEG